MSNKRYIAVNGMNFTYYKVKDENEVNELFYREYGMYPKITMSLKDASISLGIKAGMVLLVFMIVKSFQKNKDEIIINQLKKDNNLKNNEINKLKEIIEELVVSLKRTASDGLRHGSQVSSRTMKSFQN